jgi:hypothetical protein
MNVSDLEGVALDYWVARAEGLTLNEEWDCSLAGGIFIVGADGLLKEFEPSVRWEHGGPIIEREKSICLLPRERCGWSAMPRTGTVSVPDQHGPTALIAAMRLHVSMRYGWRVPDENV